MPYSELLVVLASQALPPLTDIPFLEVVGRSLTLEREVFLLVQSETWGLLAVVFVVFFAGFSESLGQSVVLFANRVKPRRFVASLALSAAIFLFSYLFWTLSIWFVGTYLYGREVNFNTIAKAVGLGYAPYLFSFFALAPYFGVPIFALLSLWSLLAVIVAVSATLDLTLTQALVCSALGWLLWQALQRTVGRPIIALSKRLKRLTAGVPLTTTRQELRDLFDENFSEKDK